jgi:hypothetical protein
MKLFLTSANAVGRALCRCPAVPCDSRPVAAVCETTAKHDSRGGVIGQGLVYAVVPECLVAVDASGVDPQRDSDTVSGAAGHLGRGHARVEADGDAAVPQIVRAGSQRRCGLGLGERSAAGLLPDPAVDALAEHRAVTTVEQPHAGAGPWSCTWARSRVTSSGGIGTGRVIFLARCLRWRSVVRVAGIGPGQSGTRGVAAEQQAQPDSGRFTQSCWRSATASPGRRVA